jgi:hypothetical protein
VRCVLFILLVSNAYAQEVQQVIEVPSNLYPVDAKIEVIKGQTYQCTADGMWQDANFPESNSNGFKGFTAPMFFGMLLKPMPSQYYMKLCGNVGNWKFPIGTSTKVIMKRSGVLHLFANDAKGFFDNNSGSIQVKVELVE